MTSFVLFPQDGKMTTFLLRSNLRRLKSPKKSNNNIKTRESEFPDKIESLRNIR